MGVHKQGCRGKAFCSCGGDDRVGVELNPADLREDLRKRRKPFDAGMAEQVIRHHVRFVAEGDVVHVLGLDDAGKAVASFAEEAATSAKAEEGGAAALVEALKRIVGHVQDAQIEPSHMAFVRLGAIDSIARAALAALPTPTGEGA